MRDLSKIGPTLEEFANNSKRFHRAWNNFKITTKEDKMTEEIQTTDDLIQMMRSANKVLPNSLVRFLDMYKSITRTQHYFPLVTFVEIYKQLEEEGIDVEEFAEKCKNIGLKICAHKGGKTITFLDNADLVEIKLEDTE